jgi:hypothetical protein
MAKPAKRSDIGPTRAHPFQETNDAGLSAFASGGSTESGSQINMLAVTTGYLRATRCGLPGCGKPRQDPIHGPADD